MSAIAGIVYQDGRVVDHVDLERMLDSLKYRAPDDMGVWSVGSVGLGQCMLRTTAESLHEKLPFADAARDLAITSDARIDNRDELIAALGIAKRPREEVTDSEIILAAYERWGEDCLVHLLGDFAFAIWDGRRRVLFCARDHFGVRPFCYYHDEKFFIFASEIKALMRLPDTPRRLNEVRLADCIARIPLLDDASATLFQDILRLPPAHTLTISRDGLELRQYWALDPEREVRLSSDAEYAEKYRELLTEAVRCRLRRSTPIGSMLSGGMDSSSVVCVAREILSPAGEKLHTFSAIYDDATECDEREYSHAVIGQGGVQDHFVHPDRVGPLTDWEGAAEEMDEPLWNPQNAVNWLAYQAAHDENIRVMLDGHGGDFIVGLGYAYMNELAYTGRWIEFLKQTRATAKLHGISWLNILRQRGIELMAPAFALRAWRKMRPRRPSPSSAPSLVSAEFAERTNLAERLAAKQAEMSEPIRNCRKRQIKDCRPGLIAFSLAQVDRAAARFQIEPRLPFLDQRVAEFCFALPPEQRFQSGWNRMIVRRALADLLPEKVRWRSGKSNLISSFNNGLLTIDSNICNSVALADRSPVAEFVDVIALRSLYEQCLGGDCSNEATLLIWRIVSLALWLRRTGLATNGARKLSVAARSS